MTTGTSAGTRRSAVHPLHFQPRVTSAGSGKIQARETRGRYNRLRWLMVGLTQLLFYGLCWLDWNGRQAVLFHLDQRKFYLFDLVLWPQDVLYLALLLILSAAAPGRTGRQGRATASIAPSACRSARRASTSATGCSTSASAAACASTPATT